MPGVGRHRACGIGSFVDPGARPEDLIAVGEGGMGALVGDQVRVLFARGAGEAEQAAGRRGSPPGSIEHSGCARPVLARCRSRDACSVRRRGCARGSSFGSGSGRCQSW